MSVIVQKFGGTSVADPEKILAAARKAIRAQKDGHQVVMVVSAMGKNTDMLVDLAAQINERPPAREMDMLLSTGEQVTVSLMAMALDSLGHQAISFTGAQIGIVTDSIHTKARIRSISTEKMRASLSEGKIVIAAGFQGIDEDFNITTLGRGGSDTTAVALAAALEADVCEIYTDVEGVYTTDPRIVPEARRLNQISYDEMLEMASLGAGVMHGRSIEFAKKFGVPVHVRSSFSDATGTVIVAEPESYEIPVTGAALEKNEARLTIRGVPDEPGSAMRIFSKIARRKISTDMIVQNIGEKGRAEISFTVPQSDLPEAKEVLDELVEEVGAESFDCDEAVAKVSIVGLGMADQPGVADRMFGAMAKAGINIKMIATSEIKISVLVSDDQAVEALRAAHREFTLDKEIPHAAKTEAAKLGERRKPPVHREFSPETMSQLTAMEDIIIDRVTLDDNQARVTLNRIPDRPGLAAEMFHRIAQEGVNVDMIIQSDGKEGLANISFTVPRNDLEKALQVGRILAEEFEAPCPEHVPTVAKLMVFGTGMWSHTGLAYRMFKTLADAGINVSVISTSEVGVNVIVHSDQGVQGRELLEREFAEEIL
jgi:aspartate kinase